VTNREMLETRWDEMKGRVEEAWGAITDDDLRRLEGRWDQVVATIQRKSGEAIDAIEARLKRLMNDLEDELDTTPESAER
jgi:uncharacterized protein YjbJ (UPF0337 family)